MLIYDCLFLAFKPTEEEAHCTGLVRDGTGVRMDVVTDGRLHLSLGSTPLFRWLPAEVEPNMRRIGGKIRGDSFILRLDRLVSNQHSMALTPSKRPEALLAIQEKIAAELEGLNWERPPGTFRPHVTLGYNPDRSFRESITPLDWHVRELVLIHSRVNAGQHFEFERWPLKSQQLSFAF